MKKSTFLFALSSLMLMSGITQIFAQPGASAPTPPERAAAKVISIFSDAYTSVTGTDFNPNWGQTTVVSTIQIGTDNVLKYASLNYQGTQISGSVNAAPMNKLHLDVWTSDATQFQITPISPGPKEFLITLSPLNLNEWNSYDLDLTQFTGVDFNEIFQFKIVGNGTVYIDNLYFYDSSTTVDAEAPTAFSAEVGSVVSDGVEILLTATDNSGSVNYVITYGDNTVNASGISAVQKSVMISGLASSTEYSFSVTAKDPTGNEAANSPLSLQATTLAGMPAAPIPTMHGDHVISIFSDSYTNVAGTNFYPGWGQSTVPSEVMLSGNNTLKYTSFNYQGIELGSHVDVSAMDKLHVDIYPLTETSINLTPISPGHELPTSLGTLTAGQWNSFDISLSVYAGVLMNDIFQFKFDGGTGKTFYMDNLYFFDSVATSVAEVHTKKKGYIDSSSRLILQNVGEIDGVKIYNVCGQCVLNINHPESQNIDLSKLSLGNYIVLVKSGVSESIFKVSKTVR